MPDETFTVVRERDSWLVVGPLSSGSSRVIARCDERRDAETIVLLLTVPFDDVIQVVRAVAEVGAEDDLSLVQIRTRIAGLGATAARWLTRADARHTADAPPTPAPSSAPPGA
jgi:hypothetical protein